MMKLSHLQNITLYIFFLSINFEMWAPLSANFSVSRITGILYFVSIIPNIKYFLQIGGLKPFLKPIWLFFGLLTIVSLLNTNSISKSFFEFSIFQNIILFWILLNHERKEPGILQKGMFSFAIGSIGLALLFQAGIGVEYEGGRVSLFGDNENIIGIRMSISSVILGLVVFQNQFALSKSRFLLLAAIPVLLKLMAETGSRVALFSFALMFVTGTLLFKTKRSWYKIIILAFGAIGFIYVIQYLLQSEILLQRILLTRSESDLAGRDDIWQKLIPLIKENPVFGVGITGYEEFARSKFSQNTSPHNVIIEILCYSGIIGLIFYSLFIFRVTKQALSVLRTKKIIMPLLLLVPIAGIILSGQILNVKIGWLIFAYVIGEGLFSNNMEHSNRIE